MRIDEDTIVALATPPGIGAVSRLSGERAIELAAEVFHCSNPKKASFAAASSPGGASRVVPGVAPGISFEASLSHLLLPRAHPLLLRQEPSPRRAHR